MLVLAPLWIRRAGQNQGEKEIRKASPHEGRTPHPPGEPPRLGFIDWKGFGLDLLWYGSTDEPSEYVLDQN